MRAVPGILLLALTGCLPFGKKEPKALFPADSLSRGIAQTVDVEPLVLDWRVDGGESAYLASLVFGPDSLLWTGDLGNHAVRRFSLDGEELESRKGFSFPYLVAGPSDALVVYEAGSNRLVSVDDTSRGIDLPSLTGEAASLSRQVATVNGVTYVKDARPPVAIIRRLSTAGKEEATTRLPGPSWHHFGVLRPWLDRVVSASSYRPVIYLLDPSGRLDSLRLQGFDSPMLARIRAFSEGAVDEPPLVISGVYGTHDALYVLNVRPGTIRIDVFDRTGRLLRILQREEPEPTSFTPVDLVVRADGDSTRAYVASVSTVYGPLSLEYASHLDGFSFGAAPR